MGCGGSAEVGGRRTQNAENGQPRKTGPEDMEANNMILFDEILCGVQRIVLPPNIAPLVSSSKYSFPLVASGIPPESTNEETQIPIIAASVQGKSRILCFPQASFFDPSIYNMKDTLVLLRNGIQFLCRAGTQEKAGLVYGFPKEMNSDIELFFETAKFPVEIVETLPNDSSDYRFLIIPSNLSAVRYEPYFDNFLNNSGGIGVFFYDEYEKPFSINTFINKYGLTYVPTVLNSEADADCFIFKISGDYSELKALTLIKQLTKYRNIIHTKNATEEQIAERVLMVKFHALGAGPYSPIEITASLNTSIHYLERTKFIQNEKLCQDMKQGLVASLAVTLAQQLPAENVIPFPGYEIFPGINPDSNAPDGSERTITIRPSSWASTGFWLSPNQIGEIECDIPYGLLVQVGSHTEDLTDVSLPWKRWPSVVSVFAMSSKTRIATPFGGIVYIALEKGEEEREVNLKFSGFQLYPRAVGNDITAWDNTFQSNAPWGEIETQFIIFTVPRSIIKSSEDPFKLLSNHQKMGKKMVSVLGVELFVPHRVVFDVQLPSDDPICGYPLVFDISDAESILCHFTEPDRSLFSIYTLLAVACISEECLEPAIEMALASVAATAAIEEVFGRFEPFRMENQTLQSLYIGLLESYHTDSERFTHAVRSTLAAHSDTSTEDLFRALMMDPIDVPQCL